MAVLSNRTKYMDILPTNNRADDKEDMQSQGNQLNDKVRMII